MKPQTNHEWWDFYTNYCREKFRKNISKNYPYADAIYLAYEQTIELRTIPGDKTRFNSVNFEVLNQWAEKYDKVVDAVYNQDKEDIRCCEQCGFPMIEGFYLAGEFACCEECCLKAYDGDKNKWKKISVMPKKLTASVIGLNGIP